jgi:Flp pilus assembly protein TadD
MAKITAILSWLFGVAGCSDDRGGQMKSDGVANADHDTLYMQGCNLIKPYMMLTDGHARPANTQKSQQELRRGITLLTKVVAINLNNWSAYWIMGKAYQALGESENACDAFGKSFDIQRGNPDVAREYMFECLKLGRGSEGVRVAQHAVSLRPQDGGLVANLALAYLIAGRNDDALGSVNESLRIAPDDKITQSLKKLITEVRDGKRAQPKTIRDLPGG